MIYDISYKTLIGRKPLQIRFGKIGGFIKIYDETKYLVLLDSEKYGTIYDRIRYFSRLKSSISYFFSYYFSKIKVDFYDSLLIEQRLTLHDVLIHITSVLNKDKSHYYYKIFLEKVSYQLAKK